MHYHTTMKTAFRRLVSSLLEFQTRRLLKRRHFKKIIAVSGAVGKTTTKLAIATILHKKFEVLTQDGSFNDEIGLPLACFDLDLPAHIFNPFAWLKVLVQMEFVLHRPSRFEVLVIEVGTDAPGEIPHTMKFLHPDIGVVTSVAPEHTEFFKSLDAVAAEELSLLDGSTQVVVSYDDVAAKYRRRYVESHPKHYYYGLKPEATYQFDVKDTDPLDGTTGTLVKQGRKRLTKFTVSVYSHHSARSVAAAFAVGDLLGLSAAELAAGLEDVRPMRGRMNPLQGVSGSRIIDDTYNSSPSAVIAALETLDGTPAAGRRIAILGSMNELGAASAAFHAEVGKAAAGVDLLVTIGQEAGKHLGPAAVGAGLDPTCFRAADTPQAAGEYVKSLLSPGDVVLVKGSQNGIFAEEAVKILLANPMDADHLVRQSQAWMRTKARSFKEHP